MNPTKPATLTADAASRDASAMAMKRERSTPTPSPRAASSPSCIAFSRRASRNAPAKPTALYAHTSAR